jgi:glycerophosphoryl diester phosphodiesterase
MNVFAHRGYSGAYPENTMLAFEKALECGSYGIELDVQLSKDGEVVIIHDETLDRTTDRKGRVCDYSLKELQTCNAGAGTAFEDQNLTIPTFEEYCSWVASTPLITNIELKTSIIYYPEIEEKTWEIIKRHKLEEKVLFSSFNHLSLAAIKALAPSVPCGALVPETGLVNAGYCANKFGFECYHPAYCTIDAASVAECHEYNIQVNVWTVNSMEALENCYAWGCDGVFTNFPAVCKAYIEARQAN